MKAVFTAVAAMAILVPGAASGQERKIIRIATDNTDLVLEVGPNKRLYQTYLGPKLRHESDLTNLRGANMPDRTVRSPRAAGRHIPPREMRISLSRHSA